MENINQRIRGNPNLAPLNQRIPEEPLVVVPYFSTGKYGGTLDVMSNSMESGTADFLSIRHVNLVRFSDDLQTIVPNVAKSWSWNDNFSQLTFTLRKGHKWSDGTAFTSADIKYWYDHLALNSKIFKKINDYVLVANKRMQVQTPNPQTVIFILPSPKPGLLAYFATSFAQAFQPKHFLGQWDLQLNPKADELAKNAGYDNGLAVITAYYGNSDWTDTSTPLKNSPDKVAKLPADVAPTLESHILVEDHHKGRHFVANPYFYMVDTAGKQLAYINELDEVYVNDNQQRVQKLLNSEVDYKSQTLQLPDGPALLEGEKKGRYKIDFRQEITMALFGFNVNSENLQKRKVFADLRFRKAMSIAINRDEINKLAFFGMGKIAQYIGFSPLPSFVENKWIKYMTQFDPKTANQLLDNLDLKDIDNEGLRELPNGQKFNVNLLYAIQGSAGKLVKLVAKYWSDVGINTTTEEVTTDQYRVAQSANELDVSIWKKGQPSSIIQANNELWVPPYESYFGARTGILWAKWLDTNGESGVEQPKFAKQLIEIIPVFQSASLGSKKSIDASNQMVKLMTENLLFIGILNVPAPIYHINSLKNFKLFNTHSLEYYRTYPYRPQQCFLDE